MMFHQGNATVHKVALVMEKLKGLKYELLERPPYWPDLAPSNFHLIPNRKTFFNRIRLGWNIAVIVGLDANIAFPRIALQERNLLMRERRSKCI